MKNILIIIGLFFLVACNDDSDYVEVNEVLTLEIPSNFPELAYDIESNPPTEVGFELGRKLFYDGNLSSNGFVSCGFCHEQNTAFTHHGHQFSHGVDDQEGTRNTPSIQNVAFKTKFTWDGATEFLDLFPIIPITNEVEMGETMTNVLAKIEADSEYQDLFSRAFDDGEVNLDNFLKSLSQFMVMMISSNSKYDKYVRGEEGGDFSDLEVEGLALFQNKCANCHVSDIFTDDAFRNNGLAPDPSLNDLGRETVTGLATDRYKFKVPSLRNVELTEPYMHDGRFGSLEAVLNFYSDGVTASDTLDELLINDEVLGIALTEDEKEAIIAFLYTLTDDEYINDERFEEF
ncbi:cytochrome-c peroxidase [Cellulophaga baltica]|uniref:cytochrome-c peroxidase n=1 Tax=Cellulophaga TaxID=104264 RepID=UPI001C079270|nr:MULTISPECIES: cytochrome c peroxidase [Cellulophaga]MBU2996760.1 cytochrome-c peroxidase [Cellulophaga baltica]MDO6768156.1 cytochrome c peroxidase [Cellulophaga sp. 1_MG-2023]